jgi:hypothetical protein
MVQGGEQARLALEGPTETVALDQGLLQRDGDPQTLVDSLVDSAHTAAADGPHDPVAAL